MAGNLAAWHKALPALKTGKTNDLFGDVAGDSDGAAESEELEVLFEDVALLEPLAESNGFSFRDAADWQAFLAELKATSADDLVDKAAINDLFKRAEEAVLFAYKVLRPDKDKTFNRADIRGALKRLSDERSDALFVLERIAYFEAQVAWLDSNFPEGVWRDVEGLCRIASRAEIAEQNFSLNPGRFVGVAMEDDGMTEEDFRRFMLANADTLRELHTEADQLQRLIAEDLTALFTEAKAEAV